MDKKVVNKISKMLNPTEEQKERMYRSILNKHKNKTTKKRGINSMNYFKHALVGFILVVCLITTTAFAAVYMGLDINLLNFLKPSSKEQAEHLANGAYVVDEQVQDKNGTLDIKQVIGDSNMTLILMDFIAPEEITLNKAHYSFENIDIDLDNDFADYELISLKDENNNDNRISLIMNIKTNESLAGQKIHLKLTNLGYSDIWPGELTTILSGEWETSFNLDFINYSTDYKVDKKIKMFDYYATIETISISPISIALKLKSSSAKEISKAAGIWKVLDENEYSDRYPVTINYKDGTSETTNIFKGMTNISYTLGDMLFVKTFENVINDKKIKSVIFFDSEINIAQ